MDETKKQTWEEIRQEKMKSTFPDYSENGKCTLCGKCCTNIQVMTQNEIRNVKEYIQKHHITPVNRNVISPEEDVKPSNVCPFLDEANHCKIYKSRFSICRHFDCSKHKLIDDELPFHVGEYCVNVLGTFFPDEFNPNPPNLEKINNDLRKKEMSYRRF